MGTVYREHLSSSTIGAGALLPAKSLGKLPYAGGSILQLLAVVEAAGQHSGLVSHVKNQMDGKMSNAGQRGSGCPSFRIFGSGMC